jgi:hypothetical protein
MPPKMKSKYENTIASFVCNMPFDLNEKFDYSLNHEHYSCHKILPFTTKKTIVFFKDMSCIVFNEDGCYISDGMGLKAKGTL